MTLRFTLLGCGSSPGVPRIHGDWGACDPSNPLNRRLRCSLLVERISATGRTVVVIDTSPDFREQMLRANVTRLDAVVYTHPHADHIHGIDDLRGYAIAQRHRIPVYADRSTGERLLQGFSYCFETPQGSDYPPILDRYPLEPETPLSIDGPGGAITFLPVPQIHGNIASLGFRIGGDLENLQGGLAYSPDVSDISAGSAAMLENLDVWIVDALQYKPHVSHFSLNEALDWIERLGPKRAILTHMHVPLDYDVVTGETPANVVPGHDGLVIEL